MATKPSFSEMHEIWSLESCLEKRLLDASCLHLKASVVVVSLLTYVLDHICSKRFGYVTCNTPLQIMVRLNRFCL